LERQKYFQTFAMTLYRVIHCFWSAADSKTDFKLETGQGSDNKRLPVFSAGRTERIAKHARSQLQRREQPDNSLRELRNMHCTDLSIRATSGSPCSCCTPNHARSPTANKIQRNFSVMTQMESSSTEFRNFFLTYLATGLEV
jgi:hypothetical protein